MKMNYNTENRTPRDRLSDELFFKEYGTEYRRTPAPAHTCACAETGCGRRARENQCRGTDSDKLSSKPCGGGNAIDILPLSMVYAPMQEWRELLDPETALHEGTLFGELLFPFYPTNCNKGRECR